MVRNFINNSVNAQVEFKDVSLSFLSSFPQANVTVDDLKITNFEPFKDETLASVKTLSFDMSIKELFKTADDGPIIVNSININEALVTLKTNKFGDANYDITKKKDSLTTVNDGNLKGLNLDQAPINILRLRRITPCMIPGSQNHLKKIYFQNLIKTDKKA